MTININGTTGISGVDGTTSVPALQGNDSNTGISFGTDTVAISTNGTGRLFVDSDGKVGIGTTSNYDDSVLEVRKANGGDGVAIRVTNDTTTNGSLAGVIFTNSTADFTSAAIAHKRNDNALIFFNGQTAGGGGFANATEAMRLDSSNRLLVGTSTALSAASSAANASVQIVGRAGSSTDEGRLAIARGESATKPLILDHIIGRVFFTDNVGNEFATIGCHVDNTSGSGDYPGRLVFSTTANGAASPTERAKFQNNGTFNVYSVYSLTTANAANVHVLSSGALFRSTSSSKYKTDIEVLQDSYADALLSIRPVWYRSTCASDDPTHSYWGFLAEEVAAVDPRLVQWKTVEITYDEEGSAVEAPCAPEPEGVQYDRFVPHLLNLIKRQKEQIEAQSTAIAALEARLTALESA